LVILCDTGSHLKKNQQKGWVGGENSISKAFGISFADRPKAKIINLDRGNIVRTCAHTKSTLMFTCSNSHELRHCGQCLTGLIAHLQNCNDHVSQKERLLIRAK
jgi:hypothetical protein